MNVLAIPLRGHDPLDGFGRRDCKEEKVAKVRLAQVSLETAGGRAVHVLQEIGWQHKAQALEV
jgi:hypothetical protein